MFYLTKISVEKAAEQRSPRLDTSLFLNSTLWLPLLWVLGGRGVLPEGGKPRSLVISSLFSHFELGTIARQHRDKKPPGEEGGGAPCHRGAGAGQGPAGSPAGQRGSFDTGLTRRRGYFRQHFCETVCRGADLTRPAAASAGNGGRRRPPRGQPFLAGPRSLPAAAAIACLTPPPTGGGGLAAGRRRARLTLRAAAAPAPQLLPALGPVLPPPPPAASRPLSAA